MTAEPPDYTKMTRQELLEALKRLRREEAEITAEWRKMLDGALAGVTNELWQVRACMGLREADK